MNDSAIKESGGSHLEIDNEMEIENQKQPENKDSQSDDAPL